MNMTTIYCDMNCIHKEEGFCTRESMAITGSVYSGVGICMDFCERTDEQEKSEEPEDD